MKKTKIILPAIALLAVSGIASVTGTVAWFTAANTATFATGAITAVATDSNLSVNHIAASAVNCSTGNTITQTSNIYDSSFNAVTKEFYKAAFDTVTVDSSSHTTGKASTYYLSTTGVANSSYYCVSWISEFTAPGTTNDYDVYFDFTTSTMKATDSNAANLQKAYRLYATEVTATTSTGSGDSEKVAVETYGNHSFVWGYSATAADLTYVCKAGDATASNATSKYDSTTTPVGVAGTSTTKALSTQTKDAARSNAGYLGVIPADGKLMVQFVVYCEGTDSACISEYATQSISSSFTFYSRNVAGYTAAAGN